MINWLAVHKNLFKGSPSGNVADPALVVLLLLCYACQATASKVFSISNFNFTWIIIESKHLENDYMKGAE